MAKKADKKETAASDSSAVVKEGSIVSVEYKGTFDDGVMFDASEVHGKPLEFTVGARQVIQGFDKALVGMKKGEEKKVRLPPAEAYGEHNPEYLKKVPKSDLPNETPLKAGMILGVKLPNGTNLPVKIAEVTETEVTIDFNHPLAGKALNFEFKVVDIK